MKSLLFSLLILFSFVVHGQVLGINPSAKQTVRLPALDTVCATLNATAGFNAILWTQTAGPNTALMGVPIIAKLSMAVGTSSVPLGGLIPGTYVFKAVGSDLNGGLITGIDSVLVLPAKTLVGITTTAVFQNGVWVNKTVASFSDGTTQ